MEPLKTMGQDTREINSIWMEDDSNWTVGDHIDKIIPYHENGQYNHVTWFAIIKDGQIEQRVNGAFVASVSYDLIKIKDSK